MSEALVFDTPVGANSHTVAPAGVQLSVLGLNVMAIPPGWVELRMCGLAPMLNISPSRGRGDVMHRQVIDEGTPIIDLRRRGHFDLYAPIQSFELVSENSEWECLIEMDEKKLPDLMAESFDGTFGFEQLYKSDVDAVVEQISQLTIDHMRSGSPDRLFVEGLAIAMTARAFALTSERAKPVPTRGTDARIERAIDYAEAHLSRQIAVAELAAIANMSPSWFAQSFTATMGQPVHAYIRERRLDRARILLADKRLSLQQIAHACGFSDQAHMTRQFRQRFGTTPGQGRLN